MFGEFAMRGRLMGSGLVALALAFGAASTASFAPQPAWAQASQAEGARLTAFLDGEYAQAMRFSPQQSSSFGSKEGLDKLNDLSDAADLQRLEWRRGSVARMKAQFQREKLPLEAQISYDMWLDELDSAELAYKFRDYEYAAGQIQSSLPPASSTRTRVFGSADRRLASTPPYSSPRRLVTVERKLASR